MFSTVIWATDGSDHADRALGHAIHAAKSDGGELHVVHVVEKLVSGRASGLDAFGNEDELKAKIEAQARSVARENDMKTVVHVVAGLTLRIAERICEVAEQIDAGLIVVGTRGHGAVGGMVLGSVTQRLLHVSPCPILAVPPSVVAGAEPTPETAAITG